MMTLVEPLSGQAIATVDLVRLDDYSICPVLIKMDIEGHELQALQGATKTLKGVQHIVFEDHDLQNNGVKDLLEKEGFAIYYLQKTFLRLQLKDIRSPFKVSLTEPPNYLATRWSHEKLHAAFQKGGWSFLSDYI